MTKTHHQNSSLLCAHVITVCTQSIRVRDGQHSRNWGSIYFASNLDETFKKTIFGMVTVKSCRIHQTSSESKNLSLAHITPYLLSRAVGSLSRFCSHCGSFSGRESLKLKDASNNLDDEQFD